MFGISFCHTSKILNLGAECLIVFSHLTDLIFPLEVAEVLVQWTLELLLCLEPRVPLGREVEKQVCISTMKHKLNLVNA